VTQALTYYVHRENCGSSGARRSGAVNRAALKIAKSVARKTGTLFAGDLCNTNNYDPADKTSIKEVERIFDEQVAGRSKQRRLLRRPRPWGGAGEALMALKAIRKYSKVPAVVHLRHAPRGADADGLTRRRPASAWKGPGRMCRLNCHRGPATMMPLLKEIRKAVKCHVAALPVPYRTVPSQPRSCP